VMSSNTKGDGPKPGAPFSQNNPIPDPKPTDKTPPTDPHPSEHETLADSVSKYLHLPKMPHRPTKEELLAAASGFWERLKVRFKWFSIRSMRPWNADEWGAFVSWFLLGHLVWILVGTTTFFSLIILFINTVFAQGEYLAYMSFPELFVKGGWLTRMYRNPGEMDWRLPDAVSGAYCCFRIGNRPKVEG